MFAGQNRPDGDAVIILNEEGLLLNAPDKLRWMPLKLRDAALRKLDELVREAQHDME